MKKLPFDESGLGDGRYIDGREFTLISTCLLERLEFMPQAALIRAAAGVTESETINCSQSTSTS